MKNIEAERKAAAARQRRFYELHRDEIIRKRRKQYKTRKENGFCPRCGTLSSDNILCFDCLEYNRHIQKQERIKNRQRESKNKFNEDLKK